VYKIGKGTLRLGLAFVGSAHQVVELAVVADGKELVKGIYRPGDDFTFSDGVSLHNVGIEKVDFVTKEAKQ
ncbi:MAG: hypothetical protein N3G76_00555, partial [Candidatus Micrarchaeota archaeon]|nr:hypothetical protein [Candidatus Micrarchaeota archaeon]